MSQNCYPHVLEHKYQLPRLTLPFITLHVPALGSPDRESVSLVSLNHRKLPLLAFNSHITTPFGACLDRTSLL